MIASGIGLFLLLGLSLPLVVHRNGLNMRDACYIGNERIACSVNAFGRKKNPENEVEIDFEGHPASFVGIRMIDRSHSGIRTIGAAVLID